MIREWEEGEKKSIFPSPMIHTVSRVAGYLSIAWLKKVDVPT